MSYNEACLDFVTGSSNPTIPWTERFTPIRDEPYILTFTARKELSSGWYHRTWIVKVSVEAGVEQWGPRREAQYGVWSDQRLLGKTTNVSVEAFFTPFIPE
jgi:hypothetical protein